MREIVTEEDIDYFMMSHHCFHDYVVLGASYISGAKLTSNGTIPINYDRLLRLKLGIKKVVVEIYFSKIEEAIIRPFDEAYDCLIYEAELLLVDGKFIFKDHKGDEYSLCIVSEAIYCQTIVKYDE